MDKYKSSIIFSGGQLEPLIFIGMYDALSESGLKPDLIIATCGGSIAASIIQIFPKFEDRLQFIKSKDYFELLHLAKEKKSQNIFDLVLLFAKTKMIYQFPNLFENVVLTAPTEIPNPIFKIKPKKDSEIDIFLPVCEFKNSLNKKTNFYRKKILLHKGFGNERIKKLLQNEESPISIKYPKSSVSKSLEIIDYWNYSIMMRACVADPYFLEPIEYENKFYSAGTVDLYPMELAHKLSEKVIYIQKSKFDFISNLAVSSIYRYDFLKRLKDVNDQITKKDLVIDLLDENEAKKEYGFTPEIHKSFISKEVDLIFKKFKIPYPFFSIHFTLPKSQNKEYFKKLDLQWKYGYMKVLNALKKPIKNMPKFL